MAVLQPIVVRQSKRLDYIFTRGFEGFLTPAQAGLFAEAPHQGRFCSDHFGLQALLRKPQ
jgi:endonuclease/exonuclease/phosphatase family metal-dependent hydrolase